MLALDPVAVVALHRQHRRGDVQHLVRGDEADHAAQPRPGLRIAVAGAHAAADGDVEAGQVAVLADDGDQAQIVGEHVHVVERWHRHGHLELARQVGVTVDRVLLGAAVGQLLLVQPDLVVGAGPGQERGRQPLRPVVHLRVQARLQRVAGAEHVAVDVAAGRDGVQRGGVDRLHGRLQFALDDAVELEGLAGGDAQGVVGPGGGDGVQLQPPRRGEHAARGADPDHELVRRLELLPAAFVAQVAVVLLVAAVELDQALVLERQRTGDRVGQAFQQGAAQAAAAGLDVFDGRMAHGVGWSPLLGARASGQ